MNKMLQCSLEYFIRASHCVFSQTRDLETESVHEFTSALLILCSSAGDKAFAEFLSDEIKEEQKIQKNKTLPKMSGGWELELNGTEAKLIRSLSGEK